MKALLVLTFLAGSTSFAADMPTTTSAAMPGSAQEQLANMKKDVMDKCMAVKKNETTCKDLMKSCGDTKLQACMNDKLTTMKK